MTISLLLDTDIGTDVDDALALAFALRHPDIELRAVTTVSGDVDRRAQIAAKILRLAGRDDLEVAAGIGGGPIPGGRPAEMGHEGQGLLQPGEQLTVSERDAISLLVQQTAEATVQLATVGALSNLAAALEREPAMADRIERLAVMGGVFAPPLEDGPSFEAADDHNLNVDPTASLRALNAPLPLLYVPLDVTVQTALTRQHLERLRRGDRLCQGLAALIDIWAQLLHRTIPGMDHHQVATLHDPLTVACLVEPELVTTEQLPVTVAYHEGLARTFVDPVAGRPVQVVRSVQAREFADFWLATVAGP